MEQITAERGQCIYILWLDSSYRSTGWVYDEEDLQAKPKEIESVGFVCDISDRGIMVSSTQSSTGGVVSPLVIPLGSILKHKLIEI